MKAREKTTWLTGVAGILLLVSGVGQAQDDVLLLSVNRGTGATQIKNNTGGQLSMDGYLIQSDSGLLSPPTWTSLNSQQFAGWTVANPSEQAIAELNLIGSSALEAGGSLSLGSVYNGLGILPHQEDVGFQFTTPEGNVVDGMVELVGASRVPTITVDRVTGSVMLSNPSDGSFTIDSYSISSPNGLLAVEGWTSLASQQTTGWTEANPRAEQLTELNLTSASEFAARGGFNLGSAYNAAAGAHPTEEDLTLQYSNPDGKLLDGIVEFTGPLNDLVLSVNTESGEANLQNLSSFVEFDVTGYSVLSESGALSAEGWNSLARSGLGGEGWSEANPTAGALAELNPTGSTLFVGGTVIPLGSIFAAGGAEDLMLQFSTTTGVQFGSVQYTGGGLGLDCNGDGVIDVFDANCASAETLDATLAAAGLLRGDADGDGEVQFSDFVILSENFTMAGQYTDGDFDKDGEVQFSDFVILADNFGMSAGAVAAVPEPSTGLLAVCGCLGWMLGLRRSRRGRRNLVEPRPEQEVQSEFPRENTMSRFPHALLVLGLTAGLSVCVTTDLIGQTITAFQTGFEYDVEPAVFLPSELNGATGQIGLFSGEPFPEGDPTAGEDHQYIPEPDSVGFVDNPDGGRMLWVDRPTDSGTFFADLSESVILPGAVFSFQVGTRRTQGNSEAKDYDIFGLDSNGAESFHLRVSADSNIERLGYVTDDGNTVSFDFPTAVGEDMDDDLLNIGAPAFTTSDRIADVTVRMAPAGYLVDFDNGANAYTTELLSYNGSATELSQIGFTYRGVFGATAEQSGHVLDNLLVEGRTEPVTLGDFNADGNIDMGDFAILADNFVTGTTFEEGDNNFDGRVNLHDFVEFKAIYNAAQTGVAAVPEPTALALILAGGTLLLGACRNRQRLSGRLPLLAATLLVAVLSAPASAQWPDVILDANPMAYYRLDEPDGTTNLTNLGTEAIPANYEGDLTLGVPGLADPSNAAVRFEGFDGRVNIPDTTFTNNGGPHAQKSFEFWFSADEADTTLEQVLFEEGGSTRGINAYIRDGMVFVGAWNASDDDGGLTTPWPGGVGADREGYFLSAPIESNTPYHVAMVMDGDDAGREGSLSLYVNGELAAQQETGVGLLFGHTDDTSIGGVSAQTLFDTGDTGQTNSHFFLGVIDEFALYNVALSADRLFVHAGNQLPPGDFNMDGNVDLADFGILSDNFGTGTSFAQGDNNLDGIVGIQDFIEFKAVFNAAPAGAAVPEPGSLTLIGFAAAALFFVARGQGRY